MLESLSNDFEAEPVEPGEGGQVGAAEADRRGSVGHVEVFQMASVRTSIFGRPRLLPAQRRADEPTALHPHLGRARKPASRTAHEGQR